MAIDPRIRNSAGQFSAKGELSARALRKAWRIAPRTPSPAVRPTAFAAAPTNPVIQFDAVPSSFTADKIDEVNAVIRGVSVITSGLIARGHDLEVDNITLDQMQKCAESKGQVPVKVDHKSGAAAVCGFLTNFRQDEGKLKADWFLLESHPQKAPILEIARRMPRGVGLSASFVSPEKPERTKSGKAAARCLDLLSVDYVTLPAANPNGMFAAKVDTPNPAMNPEEILAKFESLLDAKLSPVIAKVDALQAAADQANQEPISLEDAAGMSDEELAAVGLTKQDVLDALEAAAEAEKAGEAQLDADGNPTGEGQGELATAGAAAPAAAAPAAPAAGASTGLDALVKQITELSAEINRLKGERQVDAETALVEGLEKNFSALAEENARLRKALETGAGKPVSPSVEGTVRFFSQNSAEGEFEKLVNFEVQENKLSKAKAFTAVIAANPEAYQDYRRRCGIQK